MTKKHGQRAAHQVNTDSARGEEIADSRGGTLAHADREFHIPLSSRAVYWQPRHVAVSEELIHVPYLFWLMENARPRQIVQIGLGDGIGFLALCQAVDKLNLETPCIGIDPVDGDTGGEALLPDPLHEQHANHYGDFSFLLRDRPEHALRHVHGSEIDLLVLNSPLSDSLAMTLRGSWLSRLSDRAVVLLHDSAMSESRAGQEFRDELARGGATIRIQQGAHKLETMLVGEEHPERLLRLSRMDPSAPGALAARQVFRRLGQGLVNTERVKGAESCVVEQRAQIEALEDRLANKEDELAAACDERDAARAGEEAQARHLAEMQARLFDAEQAAKAQDESEAELNKLRAELSEAQTKRKAFYTKSEELSARAEELERQLAEAGESHDATASKLNEERQAREAADTRAQELERRLEEVNNAHDSETAKLREQLSESQEELKAFHERNQELELQLTQADSAMTKLKEELNTKSEAHVAADTRAEELERKLSEAHAAHDAAIEKLNAELGEQRQAREAADTRVEELTAEKQGLETTLEERLSDIVALSEGFEKRLAETETNHTRDLDALRDEKQQLEKNLEARTADIVALTSDAEKRLKDADAQVQKLRTQFSEAQEKRAEFRDKKEALEARLAERNSELNHLRETHETEIAELRKQLGAQQAETVELGKQLKARQAEATELRKQLEAQRTEEVQVREQLEARFREIATLTEMLEKKDESLKQLRAELDETRAHREELLNSTSWKITAPARKVINTARGRRETSESAD